MVTFVLGATNRPQDLDEAARRRLVSKRIYIPLPNDESRLGILEKIIRKDRKSKCHKERIE